MTMHPGVVLAYRTPCALLRNVAVLSSPNVNAR